MDPGIGALCTMSVSRRGHHPTGGAEALLESAMRQADAPDAPRTQALTLPVSRDTSRMDRGLATARQASRATDYNSVPLKIAAAMLK
ncbi:hypothetical protein XPN_2025 [Xanthomonas arboricola pv. pruni MAFF 301427]|nr:hypothetical protein XPN_2025 [Xanthomonas arboricola pv. pruni MAFF 301427]